MPDQESERTGFEIAVVGMACRFPGAPDIDAYWANLSAGVESITFFSAAELKAAGVPEGLLDQPGYVRARGVLAEAESFDAAFFDITPNEAAVMDPQHRIFLELAWTALEHSGHNPDSFDEPIGVYAGAHENGYAAHLRPDSPVVSSLGPFAAKLGNEKDYLATRVAYKLNLEGPALSVQTACSTSLVAVHLASQALLAGECSLALAGGVTVHHEQRSGYLHEPGGIFSSDGHCRPYDATSTGAVSGSGGGVVVLRRLADALADGDTVHAVLLGSAINNDGARRAGYTAPGARGQAAVIRTAQQAAGVSPASISYVEGHGSATELGDPIEVAALTSAFGLDADGRCALGSVKGNIGHTHVASGVAGLIKTVLALRHRQIPPSLHFTKPNPHIDFDASPFRVNDRLADWTGPLPLRAGVSSFGMGGANAHVVVEEGTRPPTGTGNRDWHAIVLSARTQQALDRQVQQLGDHLTEHPDVALEPVAHTLQSGRRAFPYRAAVVGRDTADVSRALRDRVPGTLLTQNLADDAERQVAFVFPGVGDLRAGVTRDLYREQSVFREQLDECAEILTPLLGLDVRTELYPAGEPAAAQQPDLLRMLGRDTSAAPTAADDPLSRTLIAQPTTFAVEYALAKLWLSWGVVPDAMLGYSIGEFTAATLAGVFRLADALTLVAERARLTEKAPPGSMLAVPLPADRVAEILDGDVWLAIDEGPALCVVAGTEAAVRGLADRLAADGMPAMRVRAGHPFHCPLLADVAEEFGALVDTVPRGRPTIPYLSNVTGDWITDEQAVDGRYWARHLCQPVRFAQGLRQIWLRPGRALLEIGPGQAMTSAALQALSGDEAPGKLAVASMPGAFDTQPESKSLLTAAAKLWLHGAELDWRSTHTGRTPARVPLPTYPFERVRYWIDGTTEPTAPAATRRPELSAWFSVPTWESTALPPPAALPADRRWLILPDDGGVGDNLARLLRERDQDVVVARPDDRDGTTLLAELAEADRLPDRVVHLSTLRPGMGSVDLDDTPQHLDAGFFSVLAFARAFATLAGDRPLDLTVVSSGLHQITGDDPVNPGNASVLGPCRVLPLEHQGWTARAVDLLGGRHEPDDDSVLAGLLLDELAEGSEPVIAYRGRRRWRQDLRPVHVAAPDGRPPRLRDGGHYLIVGGLGGVGLTLAGCLAREANAKLTLITRTPLVPRPAWPAWLDGHSAEDRMSRRIQAVRELEADGAEVLCLDADVTNPDEMRAALGAAEAAFGPPHGVIHAAGELSGGLAQLKDPDTARAAMAAKTTGTVVLDRLLRDTKLDWFVLCSSTLGMFGAVGQVDYCAANSFLDAYAQRPGTADRMVVSVDWDGWQQVGMVAEAAASAQETTLPGFPVERVAAYPLLDQRQLADNGRAVYQTDLDPARHWVLDEHRMDGHPVVAGTVYAELVMEAVQHLGHRLPIELNDVMFMTPCVVEPGRSRRLHLVLEPDDTGYRFDFTSRHPLPDGEPKWIHHVSGRVVTEPTPAPAPSYPEPVGVLGEPQIHKGPMGLTGRSLCLEGMSSAEHAASASIVLPSEFRSDLDTMSLHPALLDIAVGYVNMYASPVFRMPLAWRKLRLNRSLPARLTSHLRVPDGADATQDTVTYDAVLVAENGEVAAVVEELTMKRPSDLDSRLTALAGGTAADVIGYQPVRQPGIRPPAAMVDDLKGGITAAEGAAAFARIFGRDLAPQVLITPRPLSTIAARFAASTDLITGEPEPTSARDTSHGRPTMMTEYVAPRTELEAELVRHWQELLGFEPVGVHDNFAELGGHSLLGIRLGGRIRQSYDINLSLAALFEAPTVAGLAEVIETARRSPRG